MTSRVFLSAAAIWHAMLLGTPAAPANLAGQFRTPPPETQPWCFWYWMNDHISRQGITRDLESMQEVGIGTALIANIYIESMSAGPVPVLSSEWLDLTVHAIREGRRLGIDIGLFNCAGWSQSGGPWVKQGESMRFLAWTETRVRGGERFSGLLPSPGASAQDVAVVAVPVPPEDRIRLRDAAITINGPDSPDPVTQLIDGKLDTVVRFPTGASEWIIDLAVPEPATARSLALYPARADFKLNVQLQVVADDGAVRAVRTFACDRSNNRKEVGPVPYAPVVIALPETTARRWRLVCRDIVATSRDAGIAEIELSPAARVERAQEKQLAKMHPLSKPMWDAYLWPTAEEPPRHLVSDPARSLDLTREMTAEGRIDWVAPAGDWVIFRYAMQPTGIQNHPASPRATGFEVDKMSRGAMRHQLDAFVKPVLERLGADERRAFKYVAADSYETGSQNWTDDFATRFKERYRYDPRSWLPVLAGRVVGSAEQSDRFLWDLRRLVADRVAYDYVAELRDWSHAAGMKSWLENYGHWGFPGEFLQYGGQSDLVAGEFWVGKELGDIECRAASSAAHIYGQPIVYAEAFTSSRFFDFHPYAMKARGDWAFTEGINHFVIQTVISQPNDDVRPGVNAWFGTEFNRLNTWWGSIRPWIDYLRRCHLLLQHGRNVAQVAYFIGEDAPKMTGVCDPALPPGYAFDYINAEVILNRLSVRDGRFVLPEGTTYDLLVLPRLDTMRPAVLRKLRELVQAGGAILGEPPKRSPSLEDYPRCDEEVRALAADIWGQAGARSGRVFRRSDLAGVLNQLGVRPAIREFDREKVRWVHRSSDERDLYFVSNQTAEPLAFSPTFAVSGRTPQLWDATTGKVETTARFESQGGRTRVDLTLGPRGSLFVVFPAANETSPDGIIAATRNGQPDASTRIVIDGAKPVAHVVSNGAYRFQSASGRTTELNITTVPDPMETSSPWRVRFPPRMDVPGSIEFPVLKSWTESGNEAVRHFSGTAVYVNTISFPAAATAPNLRYYLELGRVEVVADVSVNGRSLGTTWLPPYRIDVTSVLRPGENRVEVKVTNLWRNRIMGDAKFPDGFPGGPQPKEFKTFILDASRLRPGAPLAPSGLLGPVRLVAEQSLPLKMADQ